jgi:hypothetical protein
MKIHKKVFFLFDSFVFLLFLFSPFSPFLKNEGTRRRRTMAAAGNADKGGKLFKARCAQCHTTNQVWSLMAVLLLCGGCCGRGRAGRRASPVCLFVLSRGVVRLMALAN